MKCLKKCASLLLAVLMLASVLTLPASAYNGYMDTLTDGRKYTIATALNTNFALDLERNDSSNGTNISVCGSHWGDSQVFTISHVYGDWYKIVHTASGKVLDIEGGSSESGTNVCLWPYHGGDNQLWKFVKDGGGYRIKSKLYTGYDENGAKKPDLCLDVSGGAVKDNQTTNVWVYSENGTCAQCWFLGDLSFSKFGARYWNPYAWRGDGNSVTIDLGESNYKTVSLQVRGPNIKRIDMQQVQTSWQMYYGGDYALTVKPIEGSGTWLGGSLNPITCKFKITAKSWAEGTYNMKVTLTQDDGTTQPVLTHLKVIVRK